MNFTLVDGGAAVLILLSAILAYSRGFVREVMAIVGWVAAAVLAYLFAGQAAPLVREIPKVGEFLGDNCELSLIVAFAGVFAIALVVASLFTPLFASAVQRSALGGLDQGLGFLFGVLRGLVLVAVGFLVYDRMVGGAAIPVVDDSRAAQIFASVQTRMNEMIPSDALGWIVARYEDKVGSCGAPATPAPSGT